MTSTLTTNPATNDVYLIPATPGQRRFWAVDQLGNASAMNMPLAWRLKGPVRLQTVTAALNAVVARHEVLRTAICEVDGQLMQVISPGVEILVPEQDLRELTSAGREAALDNALVEESRKAFDIARSPLIRSRLIWLSADECVLAVTMHHAVCDGWSNGVLLDDFAEFYQALSEGREPNLAELPLQYADWFLWMQQRTEAGEFNASLEFWKSRLLPLPPALQIPADRPRSREQGPPGHIESLLLDAKITSHIYEFCSREHLTPYMFLLAVFQILASKYSGQKHFALGSPVANRTNPETERLIGLFANPQVVVADLRSSTTLRDVIYSVRDYVLESMSHQELPFETLLDELRSAGAAGGIRMPVYFLFQKAFMRPRSLGEISIEPLRSLSPGAQFEMLLGVVERVEGVRLQLEYNSSLFDRDTIRNFLRSFEVLIRRTLDSPDARLAAVDALNPEHRWLLKPGATGEGPATCLNLCYPLNVREASDRLASALVARSMTGKTIAIAVEPGFQTSVAALAVWKADAACAPLDPRLPKRTFLAALASLQADAIVVAGSFPGCGIPQVQIDESGTHVALRGCRPEDIACVYLTHLTAGGRRVSVTHANLARTAASIESRQNGSQNSFLSELSLLETKTADLIGWPDAGLVHAVVEHHGQRSRLRALDQNLFRVLDSDGCPVPVGAEGRLLLQTLAGEFETGLRARLFADGTVEPCSAASPELHFEGLRFNLAALKADLEARFANIDLVLSGSNGLLVVVQGSNQHLVTEDSLREALSELLPPALPTSIIFNETPASQEPNELTEATQVLVAIWGQILGNECAGPDDDFFAAGGNSLLAIRLCTRIQDMFARDVRLMALAEAPTPRKMAARLASRGVDQPVGTVIPLQKAGTGTPVFCVYGVFLYAALADQFRGERPVYGVYLPEEFDLAALHDVTKSRSLLASIPNQAAAYIAAIRKVRPAGPYILAGESYGGVVAFEMAQQLRVAGERVELVALLDSHAPGVRHEKSLASRLCLHWSAFRSQGPSYLSTRLKTRFSPLRQFTERADQSRKSARTVAFRSYNPSPYQGPLALFRATERDNFEMDAPEELWGWKRLGAGSLDVFQVPGDHLSILRKPNVSVLGEQLRGLLHRQQAREIFR